MLCVGAWHTISLSDDGVVHSFGKNNEGQLGLGHKNDVSIPTPIPNLPKIKQIACGWSFSFCIDDDGFLWGFGKIQFCTQFRTGYTNYDTNVPQQILNIPLVVSVACGYAHVLIITNNSDLWSCGDNAYGQLCLGNREDQSTFKQTSFSDVSKISIGGNHSLFQDIKGEIYTCGCNDDGRLGLGHFEYQFAVVPIPNLPLNIIQFVCGYQHSLFLDSEGNVFSVGNNGRYQLGLGHDTHQHALIKIPNIPAIQTISCDFCSSYLIDFEGNLWAFGANLSVLLGDKIKRTRPTKIERLTNMKQISYGSCGRHFLAKDSLNKIFVSGSNADGQLGIENTDSVSITAEINSKYYTIWGDGYFNSKAKSARK